MQKSDQLLHTKLRPPFIRPSLVSRPRLQAQIAQGLRGPLTLIVAPAGFGKTTLVASCVPSHEMPIAWLSLDQSDNQAEHFLTYLVAALQETDKAIGSKAAQLMSGVPQAATEAVLTSLINDLDTGGREIALIVDDYHFIHTQAVHEAVAFLLEHCPTTFHILISTRSDPPLPLARLRARGQTVELRAADLRFTNSEVAQFLNDVMSLDLDAESVSILKERTEGWIAGLQMAALSMRDREDVLGFIKGFSGTNRYILDYLLEEVLAGQSPEIQRFLLYTSILERLTAPLCDVLLKDEGGKMKDDAEEPSFIPSTSASTSSTRRLSTRVATAPRRRLHPSSFILDFLERANLFLVPLDHERQWYRYHHLFADLLRAQLQKSLGDQDVAQLHLRASEWYEQNGSILEAIHHASMASDNELVERLIEENYLEMMNRGEMAWVRFWMGKLSEELVYRRPWLCLYEALNRSWFGQLEEANRLLNEAEKRIRSDVSAPDKQTMLSYHAYVKSRVTAMQGDTHRAIELCLLARENVPADNLALQIDFSITLGYEYFLYGEFENADKTLHEMIRSAYTVRAINNPVAGYCLLARLQMIQGRLHEAGDIFQKAGRLIHETSGQNLGVFGLVEVGIAALLYEWNDVEPALLRLKGGLDCLPMWGKADDLCLAYITLARIQLAQGNRADAIAALEKAVQVIQTCGVFSEARSTVETTQVKMWLIQEDWLAVDHWVAAMEQRFGLHDPFRYEDELTHITQARVYIAQNKLEAAIRVLSCLEDSAQVGGRTGRLIEIMILKALVLQRMGNNTQADLALTKSLNLAEPNGYVRIFLDEGGPMQRLLARWLAHAGTGLLWDYAMRLLSQFDAEPYVVTDPQEKAFTVGNLVEPLSQRELEVLQLVALGRTNQEIAEHLIVSRGTVKTHTHSIYRKLDVANRTEAVLRARQLGILP
jgi:LuxR family transcriptional regulator, maltose regulon positive regulatory protein